MRIAVKYTFGQLFLLLCLSVLCACGTKKEESPVIPPVTSPLSREYIGFGVIKASFTHVTADPGEDSSSLGYLRRGSLVRVLRRQAVKSGGGFGSWVLIDGNQQQGWLKEEFLDIYDSESRARTASESMSK
jgi:hypothetical protein